MDFIIDLSGVVVVCCLSDSLCVLRTNRVVRASADEWLLRDECFCLGDVGFVHLKSR